MMEKNKKKILVTIAIFMGVLAFAAWFVISYIDYFSVRIKNVFSCNELKLIYDEYYLSDEAEIVYLFSCDDLYGVRVALNDSMNKPSDIFDLDVLCACDVSLNVEHDFEQSAKWYSSSGYVNAIGMSECRDKINNLFDEDFLSIVYIEDNGAKYVEITQQFTQNTELYSARSEAYEKKL